MNLGLRCDAVKVLRLSVLNAALVTDRTEAPATNRQEAKQRRVGSKPEHETEKSNCTSESAASAKKKEKFPMCTNTVRAVSARGRCSAAGRPVVGVAHEVFIFSGRKKKWPEGR